MLIKTNFTKPEKQDLIPSGPYTAEITDVVINGDEITVECTITDGEQQGRLVRPTFDMEREAWRFGRLLSAICEPAAEAIDTSRLYGRKLVIIIGEEKNQRGIRKNVVMGYQEFSAKRGSTKVKRHGGGGTA